MVYKLEEYRLCKRLYFSRPINALYLSIENLPLAILGIPFKAMEVIS